MIIDEIRSPIRSAIRSPIGPSRGTTFALDANAAQIRAAILDPASYASGGWLLPGLGGARLNASARASVAMQQRVDGGWEFAPHNLLTDSDNAAGYQSPNVVDNGIVAVAPPPGLPASAQVRSITPAGGGSAWRMGSLGGGTIGMAYAGGLWVRTVSGSVDLVLDVCDGGAVGFTATTTWQFFSTSRTNTPDAWRFMDLSKQTAGSTTLYVCAPRLCLGASPSPYVPTTTAAVYAPAIDWLSGIGAYGLRSEEARTNSLTNSAFVGAVAGTPGTTPTNWAGWQGVGTIGLTQSIVSTGTENGFPFIDVRMVGTSTNGGTVVYSSDLAAAVPGQVWTQTAFVRLIAGSATAGLSSPVTLQLTPRDGTTELAVHESATLTSTPSRVAVTSASTPAGTQFVRMRVGGTANVGGVIDFTLRIACPQLELGAFATSPILTYGAAATRAADTVNALGIAAGSAGTLIADAFVAQNTGGGQGMVSLNAGSAANRIDIRGNGSSLVGAGSVSQASLNVAPITGGSVQRYAVAYALNDFALVKSGGAPSTDASGTLPVTDRLTFGDVDGGGIAPLNGWIVRARHATRRMTNAQLQALTA